MVRLGGFEPSTCCSGGNRSIHLSYRRTLPRSVPRTATVVKPSNNVCLSLLASDERGYNVGDDEAIKAKEKRS